MITNEVGRMWKKVIMTYFKVLYKHLLEGTENNYKTPKTEQLAHRPRIEPGT
jgi:hypothetical protein